ncbi:MAG: thiol-disulfide oxidoreductase DCC family protein [Candidatus Limnocylindrales bacterium]
MRGALNRRSGTLLYDADCGVCAATARWAALRVAPSQLRPVPLGEVGSDPRVARLVEGRALPATLHFVADDDTVLVGVRAVLAVGRLVPRWRLLAIPFDQPVGHWLLEPLYRQVAAHRRQIGRLLGLPSTCSMPSRADRPN